MESNEAIKLELALDFVRSAMAVTNLKASQLAKKIGVVSTTLTRPLKDGSNTPSLKTIYAIAKFSKLEIPAELLACYSSDLIALNAESPANPLDLDALETAIESVYVYAKRATLPAKIFAERVLVAYQNAVADKKRLPTDG